MYIDIKDMPVLETERNGDGSYTVLAASTSLQSPRRIDDLYRAGMSLSDLVDEAIRRKIVPPRFRKHGRIEIAGNEIARQYWHVVRVKPGQPIFMLIEPAGGGDDSTKNILAIVASVFLIVATAGIATYGLPFIGIAAGSLEAQIAASVVGLVGQLAISALFPPPAEKERKEQVNEANQAGLQGNVLAKGEIIPRVVGTMRVTPPLLAQPRQYISGDDVYSEAVFALAGPHDLSDIQIDGVDAEDLNDVEIFTDDGTADVRSNEFDTYAITERYGTQLSLHKTRGAETGYDAEELIDQDNPERSLPRWHRMFIREGADYADITLTFGNLYDATEPSWADEVVYVRLRIRKEGESTWKNIGTIPYVAHGQGSFVRRIRLWFSAYDGTTTDDATTKNAFHVPVTLPVVTVDHVEYKTTDSDHFPASYTYDWLVRREGIDCWLNDTYFTDRDSRFEVEIKRSEMVKKTNLTDVDTMEHAVGQIVDFLDARDSSGTWKTINDITERSGIIILQGCASAFLAQPVPDIAALATVQVRVRNQEFSRVSVLASGLVPDWNGSIWTGSTITSNPAPHLRYILSGLQTLNPVDTAYVDDTTLVAWRTECINQGYECNIQLAGTIGEALELVASCGYARPLVGSLYGVVYERDTTGELASQIFSPRNVRNVSWTNVFNIRPTAFRCEYFNKNKNYELDEIVVDNPNALYGSNSGVEGVRYLGLVSDTEVAVRALYDFDQAMQGVRYHFEIGIEHLTVTVGDIGYLSHDSLHRYAAYARIVSIESPTEFTVDATFSYTAGENIFEVANFFVVEDVFAQGKQPGALIRTPENSVLVYPMVAFDAGTKTVEIADTSLLSVDDLVVFGPLTQVQRRVQVLTIDPSDFDVATVSCKDEGTTIFQYRYVAEFGDFTLTFPDASLVASVATATMQADAGSFTLTGQDAAIAVQRYIGLDAGSFTLTGQDIAFGLVKILTADAGSFTLTGQDAVLQAARVLTADAGTFTLTGEDAALTRALIMAADAGSFALTGQDVVFGLVKIMTADAGSFTLTGQDAVLQASRVLTADAGSFTLTGEEAGLVAGSVITAEAGMFTLTGQDAGLLRNLIMTADAGSFTLTGQDVAFTRSLIMTADAGSFTLTGQDAAFARQYVMTADAGSFTLTGQDAAFTRSLIMTADAGAFALTGQDAGLLRNLVMTADAGSFTLTGQDATLTYTPSSGPTFRSASTFTSGDTNVTDIVLSKPAGVVEGDLMIMAFVGDNNAGSVSTVPSGWTLVGTDNSASNPAYACYRKTAGASEPSTYTWTVSTGRKIVAAIVAYDGGTYDTTGDWAAVSKTTTPTAPSATAANDDSVQIYIAVTKNGNQPTSTPPSGFTERLDFYNTETARCMMTVADKEGVSSGATGTVACTLTDTNDETAIQLVIY